MRVMTLNANVRVVVALNAYEEKWWLWMPKLEKWL